MADIQFKVKPHGISPGDKMVEVWRDGVFVAGIYCSPAGIRIVSKFMTDVGREPEHAYSDGQWLPSAIIKLGEKAEPTRELTDLELADLCSFADKLDATGHTAYAIQFDERLQELGRETGLPIPQIKIRAKEYRDKR